MGITKRRAMELARRALRYGYFKTPEGGRVGCPLCDEAGRPRHDIEMYATMGRLGAGEMTRQLVAGIHACDFNFQFPMS